MSRMRLRSLAALSLALAACGGESPRAVSPSPSPSAPLLHPSCSGQPDAEHGPRCLSIVAWNDLHGQLSPDEPVVDTGRLAAGGVAALADQIAAVRATGDAVVVLDAGDLFTGPMASTLAEGAPVIEAYRLLGVDAAAIGNHEFDFGPVGYDQIMARAGLGDEAGAAGPRGALLARMAEATFPFLSANLTRRGGAPTGWPNHHASTRIRRDGFDVGVVGYTTQGHAHHHAPAQRRRPRLLHRRGGAGGERRPRAARRRERAGGAAGARQPRGRAAADDRRPR